MSTELRNIWGVKTLTGLHRGRKNYGFPVIQSDKNSVMAKMSNASVNGPRFQHLP